MTKPPLNLYYNQDYMHNCHYAWVTPRGFRCQTDRRLPDEWLDGCFDKDPNNPVSVTVYRLDQRGEVITYYTIEF
jgi:hypothetical protein